jgi:phosphoribosylglycinamide formyltransferase-1
MRLGILVSGRGSNLEVVLDAVADGRLPAVEPVLVIANRPGIRALEVAATRGAPWRVMPRSAYIDADARDAAIGQALNDAGCELAVLAGYDQILRPSYFAAFAGRTINIHPSLLPLHGGRGMIGAAVHEAVLAAGDAETGVTIHDVTASPDAGPPIVQVRLAVHSGESVSELAERVLAIEHRALVEVLGQLSASMAAGSEAPTQARR